MWIELQKGWNPPEVISEEMYKDISQNREKYPDYLVGYVGFHATFGARYFGGYARGFKSDGVTPRIASNEAYRNTMKQVPALQDIQFVCGDYRNLESVSNAVFYCDPPYENTQKYSSTQPLEYDEFWEWCRQTSKDNIVFISSYEAPKDFTCVWEKDTIVNFDSGRNGSSKRTEKLFTYYNK